MISREEGHLLQELAKEYSQTASLAIHSQRMMRMKRINDCIPDRPVVLIDEIPWHEMNVDGELDLRCTDEFARNMEWHFRKRLFQWKYFQADMILEDYFPIQKSYASSGIGIHIEEDIITTDPNNNIVSHRYKDLLHTPDQLEQLKLPIITVDPKTDHRRVEMANDVLRDILPVRLTGEYFSFSPWDMISMYRGVESVLMDLIQRPDFMHETIRRFIQIGHTQLTQMEDLGLLDYRMALLHCTPPFVSDLPAKDYQGGPVRARDTWIRGTAQMFSAVSPAMHQEFEISYMKSLFERCGLVYYGCCEPLHDRINLLKAIPNMRKIGISSWADDWVSAEQIGNKYVFSKKPNPAMVAGNADRAVIREEIARTLKACVKYGCPCEIILKDISTVSYCPENLFIWNRIVQETISEYYS